MQTTRRVGSRRQGAGWAMLKRLCSGWPEKAWRGYLDGVAILRKLLRSGDGAAGQIGKRSPLFQAGTERSASLVLRLKALVQDKCRMALGGMTVLKPAATRHPAAVPADSSRKEAAAGKGILFSAGAVAKNDSSQVRNQKIVSTSLRTIREQMIRGRRSSEVILDDILEIYKGVKKGRILLKTQLPAADDADRDVIGPAVAAARQETAGTGETVCAGSWLAPAGRNLIAPPGAVCTPGSAPLTGDAAADPPDPDEAAAWIAFRMPPVSARHSAPAAADGLRALRDALKTAPPDAELAQDCIAKAARTGTSLVQAALRRSGPAGAAAPGIARCLDAIPEGGSLLVSAGVNRAINLPPLTGRMRRTGFANRKEAYRLLEAAVPAERLAATIAPESLEHARAVAAKHGVILDLLPPARCARELIESGAAIPVPPFIHNRALAAPESLLGATGKPGSIGHYLPVLPSKNAVPEKEYADLGRTARMRIQEYCEEYLHIRRLESSGSIFVSNGVIHDAKSGKVFAGGAEVFEIRDAATGDPLPLYEANPDGSPAYDPKTGFPVCHPLREKVIRELRAGPFRARRGVARDGVRPLAEPASDGPAPDADPDARRVPEDGLLLAVWPDGRLQAVCLAEAGGAGR